MNRLARAAAMSVNDVAALLEREERQVAAHLELQDRLARANALLEWYKNQLWGAKSERRALLGVSNADQLYLGEQFLDVPAEPPAAKTSVRDYERQSRKRPTHLQDSESRLRFDESVPVQNIELIDPRVQGIAPEKLVKIGQKETKRLAQLPATYVVLNYIQTTYRVKDTDEILCPPIPRAIFERSYADVSLLAGLAVNKFQFHLPLHRQHQMMEQAGLSITRQTLTRLVHRVGELLEPVYLATLGSVLQSKVLAIDETPTPAGPAIGKMKKGYLWAFYGDRKEVAFLFSPSRGQKVLDEVLTGFQGVLLSDGYAAYESFAKANDGITPAQCWAHARRKFIEAEKAEPEKTKQVLSWIQQLYEIEARGKESPDRLEQMRRAESSPIVDRIFSFYRQELERTALMRSNPFIGALEYSYRRESEMRVFLNNAEVAIDTNHLERTLRPHAVGRKNWMFHFTEIGARYAGIFYTLVQSCHLAGIRPYEYLVDVLQRIETHPVREVHLLTPREWAKHFAQRPLRSDLESFIRQF